MSAAYDVTTRVARRAHERVDWTDERVELLKKLWGWNWPAHRIMSEIPGASRNAIIGKANRLGISSPRPQAEQCLREDQAKKIKVPRRKPKSVQVSRVALKPAAIPVPVTPSLEFKVGFFDLTNRHCRYPLWGEDDPPLHEKFFCGAAVVGDERTYCPWHHNHTHNGFSAR